MITSAMRADRLRRELDNLKLGDVTQKEYDEILMSLKIQRLETAVENRRPKVKAVK